MAEEGHEGGNTVDVAMQETTEEISEADEGKWSTGRGRRRRRRSQGRYMLLGKVERSYSQRRG